MAPNSSDGEKDASERIFEAYCKNQARGGQATDGNGNQVKPMTATFVQNPSSVLLSSLSLIDHHKLWIVMNCCRSTKGLELVCL